MNKAETLATKEEVECIEREAGILMVDGKRYVP